MAENAISKVNPSPTPLLETGELSNCVTTSNYMESFFSSLKVIHLHITPEPPSQTHLGKVSKSKVNNLKKNVQFKYGCLIKICTCFYSHTITRENTYSVKRVSWSNSKAQMPLEEEETNFQSYVPRTKITYEHRPPWTSVYTFSTTLKYSTNNPPQS